MSSNEEIEWIRQLALKMTKEAIIICFGFILLLLFVSVLFWYLEWHGKT